MTFSSCLFSEANSLKTETYSQAYQEDAAWHLFVWKKVQIEKSVKSLDFLEYGNIWMYIFIDNSNTLLLNETENTIYCVFKKVIRRKIHAEDY